MFSVWRQNKSSSSVPTLELSRMSVWAVVIVFCLWLRFFLPGPGLCMRT